MATEAHLSVREKNDEVGAQNRRTNLQWAPNYDKLRSSFEYENKRMYLRVSYAWSEYNTSGNANISSRPVRHRTEPMEPRRSGSVHLRMEMPVSIQRASETSRAREIDLAHAGFWYLGAVRPSRAGACAPTTLEPTVESGQTVEGGPRRCTLRTATTSPFGSCRSARKPISVRKFPTFLMYAVLTTSGLASANTPCAEFSPR